MKLSSAVAVAPAASMDGQIVLSGYKEEEAVAGELYYSLFETDGNTDRDVAGLSGRNRMGWAGWR
jgi:hypothetical protein